MSYFKIHIILMLRNLRIGYHKRAAPEFMTKLTSTDTITELRREFLGKLSET